MPPKKTSTKKKITKRKAAKPKAETQEPAAQAGVGHNLKVPPGNEIKRCKSRVDKLLEEKASANAKFMADIKGVYEEYGDKWGMKMAAVRIVLAQAKAQENFSEMLAEADKKKRGDIVRLTAGAAESFDEDTPFGAWARAQAAVPSEDEEEEENDGPLIEDVRTNVTGEPAADHRELENA